ncbi:primosomal replication protein PriB/PriC domain protein [Dissulfurirhabdus thermomarina]|uniref:Primosomal replication protein PriB/PriC domain protein n=1 Tax=Dissulfurirhabdus thermomarina TaxID=1765737 RepID=A0A6N9TJ25_DISTH|nr:primosomal replication protein PriB/PriC domain protein [Dissulfurirhabdus thermomarina]NDY41261.1 primosomal replication protein PriB/PriC domain protein [Dissulfurirhabdus thermomarina]
MATTAELQDRLALYRAAEQAILSGAQEYRIGERRLVRADLAHIQAEIRSLELRLSVAQQGGRLQHAQVVFGGRR